MDIYTRIREFYDALETNPLTSAQIALWFALLHTNNKARWIEWFSVASSVLASRTGLDRKGINRARNTLKQKGYIDFKANGNNATSYTLCYAQNGMANDMADGMADGMASGMSGDMAGDMAGDTIKKTKTKTKTKRNTYGTPNGVPGARARFTPPTIDEVRAYCQERGNSVNPEQWHNSYASKGWMVGKSPMKDWKAAVRTWESNSFGNTKAAQQPEKVYEEFTGWEV